MSNLTSTKTFTFAMAHLLSGHEGLCKNLHGHNYKLEVTAQRITNKVATGGPEEGMVVDFKNLKEVVNELIVNPLDHATVIWTHTKDAFEDELQQLLEKHKKKFMFVNYRPTAENMAKDFLTRLNDHLDEGVYMYRIVKIRLWETDTSYAEYFVEMDEVI